MRRPPHWADLRHPPRRLRFDIKHTLAGSVARVGSNNERYWLWIEPEVSTMWWGEWRYVDQGRGGGSLPLRPNQVLDALMMRPLPESCRIGCARDRIAR